MGGFYIDMQAMADGMLAPESQGGFGKQTPATITHTEKSFNPATGVSTPIVTSASFNVATFDYKLADVDGERIKSGDLHAFISGAPSMVPTQNDTVTMDGEVWTIKSISPLKPGSVVVLYEAQLRK